MKLKSLDALQTAVETVAALRSPKGCPWDRKQTHRSLIPDLMEESRELVQALKKGSAHEIEDELGDVLFQVLLHAHIAEEAGLFDINDVAKSLSLKLRRRHPHVFGDRKFKTAQEVLRHWNEVKGQERILRRQDVARRGLARKTAGRRKAR